MERGESWSGARRSLLTDGYVHLPNVFKYDEIVRMRDIIHRHLKDQQAGFVTGFGRVEPLAAVEIPALRAFIADPRILNAVRDLLCTPEPQFLLHCDAHWNDGPGAWHKDTGDTVVTDGYFGVPTYDYDDCLVLKLAIYCEDHLDDDGGLHVKPGSHRFPDIESGCKLTIASQVGDVVAFDVRTTHMGAHRDSLHRRLHAANRRMNSLNERVPSRLQNPINRLLISADTWINHRQDRTALFFSFAAKGVEFNLAQMFARTNWERACGQMRRSSDIPDSLTEEFSRLNVNVISI